jgi:hypothetical protein
MSRHQNASEIGSALPVEQVAGRFIASLGGDARVAVTELVLIVRALIVEENRALAEAASRGFTRSVSR